MTARFRPARPSPASMVGASAADGSSNRLDWRAHSPPTSKPHSNAPDARPSDTTSHRLARRQAIRHLLRRYRSQLRTSDRDGRAPNTNQNWSARCGTKPPAVTWRVSAATDPRSKNIVTPVLDHRTRRPYRPPQTTLGSMGQPIVLGSKRCFVATDTYNRHQRAWTSPYSGGRWGAPCQAVDGAGHLGHACRQEISSCGPDTGCLAVSPSWSAGGLAPGAENLA